MRTSDKILLAGLGIIDRLFATDLLEREVARRKASVARSEARLAEISEQLVKLGGLLEAASLQLCLLYLRQRELLSPQRWLHFDPANPQDDQGLDLLINHLVKPRLAAIEVQEVEKNRYIYKLEPDWAAIGDFLAQREADLQPEIADWLKTSQAYQRKDSQPDGEICDRRWTPTQRRSGSERQQEWGPGPAGGHAIDRSKGRA